MHEIQGKAGLQEVSAAPIEKADQGIRHELLPITNLDEAIVGWESQDDPEMPLNFSARRKWV